MSRPPPDDQCPGCGITYEEFRTGLTYSDVYLMLWSWDDDPATWRYKRRHTVLGLWMSIKKDLWSAHVRECEYVEREMQEIEELEMADDERVVYDLPLNLEPDDEIPF